MEVDFYFFADERERYWNRKIPLVEAGEFRRVELRRYRIAGEAVMPGIVLELSPRRYDAVVKSLNGKLMLPAVYLASRARDVPFVLWTGMWHHPRTSFHRLTRPATEHVYRSAEAIVTYGEHVKRFVADTSGVDPSKVYVAGQAVEAERFTAVAARAQRLRGGPVRRAVRGTQGPHAPPGRLCRPARPAREAAADRQRLARAAGLASRGAGPSRRAGRVRAPGAPACGAGALAVPCAPLDHHGSGSGAMGTRGQRGHARRPAGGGHRCGRRGGRRPRRGRPQRLRGPRGRRVCAGGCAKPARRGRGAGQTASATRPARTSGASPTAPWPTPSRQPSSTRSPLAAETISCASSASCPH